MNFRDLGALPCPSGRVRPRALHRSGELSRVTDDEARWLARELGITTYIDFRTEYEVSEMGPPGRLAAHGVRWIPVPMDIVGPEFRAVDEPTAADWARMYVSGMKRHREELAFALETIASAEGAVVFGCAAGKDRTGIAAALLLACLGVDDESIVADYARTTESITPHLDARFGALWGDDRALRETIVRRYFVAHPEAMREFLRALRGTHAAELREDGWAGLSAHVRRALRERYVTRE